MPIAYMITSDYESDLPQQRNMNRLPQIGIINEFPFLAEKKMNIFPKDSAIISSGCGKHAKAMPKSNFSSVKSFLLKTFSLVLPRPNPLKSFNVQFQKSKEKKGKTYPLEKFTLF